jgi:CheY-like chemotaxis protein
VILCDLVMPDMSGMEFYQALVQTVPTLSTRVIFLTGGAFTQTMLEFLERVPNLHLRKPLNIGELRAVVNERVGS